MLPLTNLEPQLLSLDLPVPVLLLKLAAFRHFRVTGAEMFNDVFEMTGAERNLNVGNRQL
jgi:hypothetical protein